MRYVVIAALAAATSGCAFGINYVTLPSALSAPLPAAGDQVAVQVKDGRADLSGSQVGFKRNGYGAKTGSVELRDKEILTERLARDLVALLRERGYRAFGVRELPTERADLLVNAEITSFIVDIKMGFWSGELQAFSVLRLRAMQAHSRRFVWEDIVRAETRKTGLMAIVEDDHQEVVEALYKATLEKLRGELPAEFPR